MIPFFINNKYLSGCLKKYITNIYKIFIIIFKYFKFINFTY